MPRRPRSAMGMVTSRVAWVAPLLVFLGSQGCINPIAPDVGGRRVFACDPEDSDESTDVSFSLDILPLILRTRPEGGCTCHMGDNPRATGFLLTGLDLRSYATMVRGGVNSQRDIVVDGDPCISVLYLKTAPTAPFGSQMPLGGPYWSAEERALLHDWIAEGANDN